jgi:hypothetical protein
VPEFFDPPAFRFSRPFPHIQESRNESTQDPKPGRTRAHVQPQPHRLGRGDGADCRQRRAGGRDLGGRRLQRHGHRHAERELGQHQRGQRDGHRAQRTVGTTSVGTPGVPNPVAAATAGNLVGATATGNSFANASSS